VLAAPVVLLDLMFSQPQIGNTVAYDFGVGLLLWIALEFKPVVKVKHNYVLWFKTHAGS